MRTLCLVAVAPCSTSWLEAAAPAQVTVEEGRVQGIVEDTLTVYKGISFAAPPTGDLRWRASQPFAPACMQSMGGPPPSGLNTYRVGIFRFFSHPELSAESPRHVSGNLGLLDISAGQWIQHNLARFGGDPKQHPDYPAGSPQAGHGSPHRADVAYAFEHLYDMRRPATPKDERFSDAMAAYETNFDRQGTPDGDGVPAWPAFSDRNPVVLYFAGTPHTGPLPSEASLRVSDSCFASRRSTEGALVKAPEGR